jgi:hypothetical protein
MIDTTERAKAKHMQEVMAAKTAPLGVDGIPQDAQG